MLGIDIVDLHDPRSRERNSRSFQLIEHPDDQVIAHTHAYWLLWSAKEAVFKCRREAINFAPRQIPISIYRNPEGGMRFTSDELDGLFKVTKDYLLAVCADQLESIGYEVVSQDKTLDGTELRAAIVHHFASLNREVTVGADALNLPSLLPSEESISISHHNHLGAFTYPKSILNQ